MTQRDRVYLRLCQPRGFCAGVDRAVKIVERALTLHGRPVYVRHEIVHNQHVVGRLEALGAIFVDEIEDIPETDSPVIFSAHGVPPRVVAEAQRRGMFILDATCPLVSKVHIEAQKYHGAGHHVVLIGHAGHPEVEGTLGQLPTDAITLVETVEDVARVVVPDGKTVACLTQTTLSVDDTQRIREALAMRFPDLVEPGKNDICYATTNRQAVVKEAAPQCDLFLVVGSKNSSNSVRLVEVAQRAGCERAVLLDGARDVDWSMVRAGAVVGISAGASAPEILVTELLCAFEERFDVEVQRVGDVEETVEFKMPTPLRQAVTQPRLITSLLTTELARDGMR